MVEEGGASVRSAWGSAWALQILALVSVAALTQSASPQTAYAPPFEYKTWREDIEISPQGLINETIHAQIGVNNSASAQQMGQQVLRYSEALSDLDVIEAYTIKPDGTKMAVSTAAIYSQLPEGAPQVPMFDDQRQKVVVFPDVEAGDTVDITFRRRDKAAILPGQFMFQRSFARFVAYDNVEVTITAPKTYPVYTEAHEVAFDRHDSGNNTVYHWHYAGAGSSVPDTSVLSPFGRSPRLLASSFKDYDALARAFAAILIPAATVTPKVQALADQVTQGITDKKLRAQRLYEWVSRHIRYVGIEVGAGTIVAHDADTVLTNGYGDCKDHVALYSALLKAKGIASDFVLINLGNAYALPETAVLGELNHAIAWLPELGLYADTTAGVAPFGTLPFQEYGKAVIHATASGPALHHIPILPQGLATVSTRTTAKLDAAGHVSGTSTITASGPFSLLLRQIGLGIESVGPDRAAAELIRRANAQGTATFTLAPPSELQPTYTLASSWSFGPYTWIAQGRRFEMPNGIALLGAVGDVLVGSLSTPNTGDSEPIPCYSGRAIEEISLEAPQGWHFLPSPPDANLKTAHVAFSAHWWTVGNTLNLRRDFTSTLDTALCSGGVRAETAAALAQIRQYYSLGAAVMPDTGEKPVASLETEPADTMPIPEERRKNEDYVGAVASVFELRPFLAQSPPAP
jgi:transglutaminase-like putative cysteine protease